MEDIKSLYIHIPFCNYICTFCDFKRDIITKYNTTEYINKVISELEGFYETIYIGGGTPNAISDNDLELLLSNLVKYLDISKPYEFTIEANPESITDSQAKIFKKYNLNRVSIGVQTTNETILKLVNRKHNIQDVRNAVRILKDNQIPKISLDFIYNLPFLKTSDLKDSVELLKELDVYHTSYYSLELKEGSVMTLKGEYKIDTDKEEDQLIYIEQELTKIGFNRYEVSNWSKTKETESMHNKAYWLSKNWKAIGYGAAGFEDQTSYIYEGSINEWIRKETKISDEELYFQVLMMGLRLKQGLDLSVDLYKKAYEYYKDKLKDVNIKNNILYANDINLLFGCIEDMI